MSPVHNSNQKQLCLLSKHMNFFVEGQYSFFLPWKYIFLALNKRKNLKASQNCIDAVNFGWV